MYWRWCPDQVWLCGETDYGLIHTFREASEMQSDRKSSFPERQSIVEKATLGRDLVKHVHNNYQALHPHLSSARNLPAASKDLQEGVIFWKALGNADQKWDGPRQHMLINWSYLGNHRVQLPHQSSALIAKSCVSAHTWDFIKRKSDSLISIGRTYCHYSLNVDVESGFDILWIQRGEKTVQPKLLFPPHPISVS